MAFDAGDAAKAEELAEQVECEGAAAWKLETTLRDLERSVELPGNAAVREKLETILQRLRRV